MKRERAAGGLLRRWSYVHFIIVAVLAAIIYSGIISAPFFFDDKFSIVDNLRLHDLANFWPPYGNRYVSYLSFGLNYYVGGLDVRGYHLVNILIHILNSLLVYKLVSATFKTPLAIEAGKGLKGRTLLAQGVATLSSLLFLAHPLQTSAVTYITQRFVILSTLFYLLTLLLFVIWRLRTVGDRPPTVWRTRGLYLLALLFAVLAQKTKEITFTLPFVLILYDFIFFKSSKSGARGRRVMSLLPFALTMLIIPFSILAYKAGYGVGKIVDDGTSSVQIRDLLSLSRYDYLLTQFRVIVTYLRLLFFPVNQNFDYDYPVYGSFFNPQVLLSLLLLAALVAFALFLYTRFRKNRNLLLLLASCGIFWFFITLSIESSIIPIKDVIFEHRLYLPSIGVAISVSSLLFYCLERFGAGARFLTVKVITVLVIITVLPLGIAAYRRNGIWRTPIGMYEDIVSKSPDKARSHNNLGIAYFDKGLVSKAARQFVVTLKLDPSLADTQFNLAKVLVLMGRKDEAIERYKIGLASKPDNAEAQYAIAGLYAEQGKFALAIEHYSAVLKIAPGRVNARNNLANALFVDGRINEAIVVYRSVLRVRPNHVEALYNLAMASESAGLYEEAIRNYSRFLSVAPAEYRSRFNDVRRTIAELKGAGG